MTGVAEWVNSERATEKSARKLRAHAVNWLRKVLQPHEHDHPEQLAWKLESIQKCRGEGSGKDPWPLLFEMRIGYMLRKWKETLAVASEIPLKGCHQAIVNETLLVVTRCHIEMEQWEEAEKWVRSILKSKRKLASKKELRYWLSIAIARQASQSGCPLATDNLQTLMDVIT